MKTKAVVFDWDGVLYDSAEIYVGHFNTVLADYGKEPLTLDEFRQRSKTTAEEFFVMNGISDIAEAKRRFIELTRGNPRPSVFHDTHDTLRWLHDRFIKAYVVSAHPQPDIRQILDGCGLTRFVDEVMGDARPEDKILFLNRVIQEERIQPDEVVFVDDMDTVLELAREVRCYRVGSLRGYCSYERLLRVSPDKIIRNLKNLQGYIHLIQYSQPQPRPINTTTKKASEK